ncbi:hypothetical protein V1358_11455 [Pseudoalteromonas sp. YIC-656]|uniref:hypothetical protein n=1 Tax=Pseudoalteromonas pernae TaxID=3118054 RepID=UPI0032429EB9
MRFILLLTMLVLFSCSSTFNKTYIKLKNGSDLYNSKTGILTRHFCSEKEKQITVKLNLTELQIRQIVKAALDSYQQSLIVDKDTGEEVEKICVSSYPFELELYSEGDEKLIGRHSCFGITVLENALNEIIYEQPEVKALESSRCRYY